MGEGQTHASERGDILKKIAQRTKAKKEGNFSLADQIRKDLLGQGIVIEDQQDKTVWKLK